MSRKTHTDSACEVQSLLSKLTETIGRIDPDDLSGLAQVHGWCETLVEINMDDCSPIGKALAARVSQLARNLEGLILGEVANANEAFAGIAADIQALTTETAATSGPSPSTQAPTTDPVADSLAEMFDEPSEVDFGAEFPELMAEAPPEKPAETTESPDGPEAREASYVPEPLILEPKELDFVKGFVEEAREHVEAIEAAVLEVERCPDDTAKIDDLFRPFHTIKGMAGFLNLRDVSGLTHEVETLLDQGRKGKRAVTTGVIDLVLSVVDLLKVQIASVGEWVAEPNMNVIPQPPVADMIDRLRAVVAGRLDPDEQLAEGPVTKSVAEKLAAPAKSASAPAIVSDANAETPQVSPSTEAASQPVAERRNTTPAAQSSAPKSSDQSIRIDTEKLDALIDMVGELVIAQTLVSMSGDIVANPKLARDVTQVAKIVRDVQELAMAMRMVPIGPTFQKMARLVRDVSRKAGKQVNLTISGEDTELDKTVIQEIGDPLVHMVRNAIDHGIENPDGRERAGKPEAGRVHLHAGHEGGNILISIRDDGKGLDPAVLIAKAIEKGVIQPTDELTEQQAFALVFAPGFSTAAQVTDISGRGVGMDVVKRNIDQLRGRVEITSEKGKGTTFNIRLPLTLAIIDGMVIRVGTERFILPTITIQQSLRPLREAITTVHHRGEVLNVRGEMIPLIQLGDLFGLTGRVDPCDAMVIITHCEGRLVGLVVEELIGQQQVVIKTLGEQFEKLQGVSGAAILGDGRVGLILEMTGLSAAHDGYTRTGRHASRGNATRILASSIGTPGDSESSGPSSAGTPPAQATSLSPSGEPLNESEQAVPR